MSTKKSTKRTTNKKPTASAKTKSKKSCAAPNKFLGSIVIILLGTAGVLIALCMILFGVFCNKTAQTDAERFAAEYSNVSEENPFIYASADDAIKVLEHGTGVVYLGFPSCPWCQAYAGYLSDVAKDAGLDKIYYYDIQNDRKDNTETYQKLVSILSSNLQYDESGNRRIYVPNVAFVVDGRIIGNDLESSKDTAGESDPAAYWTDARISALKDRLKTYIDQVTKASGCKETCNK